MFSRSFIDGMWNISDYVSSMIIALITTKILIDKIGSEGYGFYAFFISLVGTFGLLDIGAGIAISKYLCEFMPKKRVDDCNEIISIGFIFYTVVGSLLTICIYFFSESIIAFFDFNLQMNNAGLKILRLVPVLILLNLLTNIPVNILVSMQKWQNIVLSNVVFKVISFCIVIIIVNNTNSFDKMMEMIFYNLIGVAILKFIFITWAAKRHFRELDFVNPKKTNILRVVNFLKFSFFQFILSIFVGHLDKFIISKLFGLNTLGIYMFCVQVFSALYGFATSLFKVIFPRLSYLHGERDYVELKKYFKKSLLLAFSVNLVSSIFVVILWDPVVSAYLNSNFALESNQLMKVFLLFLIVRSFEIIFYYFFNALAKPEILVRNVFITAILTNTFYFVFIPIIGVSGIVLSQIIACTCVYIYNYYLFYYKMDFFMGKDG